MRSRGLRAGLTALVTAGLATTSACGIVGNPLASKPGASSAPSASASPSPSAKPVVQPAAGQCHTNSYDQQLRLENDNIVDCAETHSAETVYVGQFVGASARGEAPLLAVPASSITDPIKSIQNEAYLDCSTHADKYLGHSWIHMLLDLKITLPTDEAWKNGDRWYRCDLYTVSWETGNDVDRKGSLKTTWFDPICVNDNKDDSPIIDCKVKHPGEFTGGYLAAMPKAEPKTDAQWAPYDKKCDPVIGKYLGIPSWLVRGTVGHILQFQYEYDMWASGRRVVYCFTWTGEKASSYVTGSAKGRKGKGL